MDRIIKKVPADVVEAMTEIGNKALQYRLGRISEDKVPPSQLLRRSLVDTEITPVLPRQKQQKLGCLDID